MAELCFNCMNRSSFLLGDEDSDLPGQIAAASAAGFRSIGPDLFSIRQYRARGGRLEDLAALIEAAGLRTFELPTLLLGEANAVGDGLSHASVQETVDNSAAKTSRGDVEDLLEIARVLRPDFLQVNVAGSIDAERLDEIRHIGHAFAKCETRLAIEYLPWLPEVRNLRATQSLLDRLDVAGAGMVVDTWHFFFSDDSWDDLAALPLDAIAYVQFDDHPELASQDLVAETIGRRVMPGEGSFDLDRFCEVIRGKGYDGVVSCEILSDETRRMDLEEFAHRVYASCSAYWG